MKGEDADLASYIAVIKQSGIVLYGQPIDKVFGELPKEFYIKSVLHDINDAKEEYMENPAYHTLNLCRTLAYLDDHKIRSKRGGGEWGLLHVPQEFHNLIQKALNQYNTGTIANYKDEEVSSFCSYAFEQIESTKLTKY